VETAKLAASAVTNPKIEDGAINDQKLAADAVTATKVKDGEIGAAKLAGEHFIRSILERYWIVRTQWLYGVAGSSGKGGNFVELMLRLAREGRDIKVVDDQVGAPTYTRDLANKLAELIATERYGLYHVSNAGQCSWYQFACRIWQLSGLNPAATPTTTAAFGAAARRPSYSVLANTRLKAIGLTEMRPWEEALAAYLRERQTSNAPTQA